MTDYVASPPQQWTIPVTRGCDRAFSLQRVNDTGTPTPFDAGSTVSMWIDLDPEDPTQIEATISSSTAAIVIPADVCDQVRNRTRWRIGLESGDLEIPVLVGRFERHDG